MSIRRVASDLKTRLAAFRGSVRMRGSARRFLRGEGGAIAIYFGLSAIVFVGVAGLAVDAARGYLVKARLSEAIDSAALAGGKALQTANDPNNNKVKSDALAFFNANFPNGAMGATVATPTITITNNNTLVSVSSNAVIPTTLMRVLGFNQMTMVATGTVARAQGGLDVVFSFDVSGSMGSPASKMASLKSNATALVDSLFKPFVSGGQTQMITVNGTTYSLLNIGVVPWNSKVNVRTYPATTNGAISGPTGNSFTDPMGGRRGLLPGVYKAANSEVPLLLNPSDGNQMPGGWDGCVYARYWDDSLENNDADTSLGVSATWPGWEPIARDEGESGSNGFFDCYSAYWNNGNPAPYSFTFPGPTIQYKNIPSPGWPALPASLRHSDDCADCPSIGILPLQTNAQTVKDMINALSPGGSTDAPAGLAWAWEVLMPGDPFNQAKVNPPFSRAQAIVFMTDGQNVGQNGDAYHGWFGEDEPAGTTTAKTSQITVNGSLVANNLNNHLLQLASKIKGANPLDPDAVKIYVIQYQENNPNLTTLLSAVATQNGPPYYFFAPAPSDLDSIFNQIAESLSALRIVQ
jgi:Flp pilus assembly protein TadG